MSTLQRHDRAQFVAFGLLPLLNIAGLLLQGLNLSTGGSSNVGRSLAVIAVGAVVSLGVSLTSAVKRGRDMGYKPMSTIGLVGLSVMLGPAILLLALYFAFAPTDPRAEGESIPLGVRWLWAPVLLVAPWMALLVASSLR